MTHDDLISRLFQRYCETHYRFEQAKEITNVKERNISADEKTEVRNQKPRPDDDLAFVGLPMPKLSEEI